MAKRGRKNVYTQEQLVEGVFCVAESLGVNWVTAAQYTHARKKNKHLANARVVCRRVGWSIANVMMLRRMYNTKLYLSGVNRYVRVDR